MVNSFKCRWCDFTVTKSRINAAGRTVSGWSRLKSHLEDQHFERFEELEAALGPPIDCPFDEEDDG